ncbi:MAG: restriction endonuclease [Candidatus Thermoplasmatota archaeon]|jgi:DNA modification methylase|nr:restriction endonuclease [Candidatus Thermoplasmatota archaeon]
MNELYYGDNLEVLRKYIADESVDLVYLDPPFNSQADYNILYKEQNGTKSASQIEAFSDFWHWDQEAQLTYEFLIQDPNIPVDLKKLLSALETFLGHNDLSAYLIMMSVRLVELRRVLKSKGSLYLHCDPNASHYLKAVLDAIFGPEYFVNEIIWQRTNAKGLAFTRLPNNHDVILIYSKTNKWTWNLQYTPHDPNYIENFYRYVEPDTGRRYSLADLTNPNKNRPNLTYEFLGVTRVWRWTKERMKEAFEKGLIVQSHPGSVPRLKRYLDEQEGNPLGDVWTDIRPVQSQGNEGLGYQTQKPLELLERIISMGSNEGDVILDPFCGCGTALDAAEKLHRQWIGIDITHLAINVIKRRLRERYPDVKFEVIGEPKDLEGAKELAKQDRYQFQWWACSLIEATPYENKKKGADTGIDCVLYNPVRGTGRTYYGIVQVKSGGVNSGQIRDFKGTMEREKADYGIFLTLEDPSEPMNKEAVVAGHVKTEWGTTIPKLQVLTIKELLDGEQPEFPFPPDNYYVAERGKRTVSRSKEKQTILSNEN